MLYAFVIGGAIGCGVVAMMIISGMAYDKFLYWSANKLMEKDEAER